MKAVSESGSLTIQDLSSNLEGVYTCELNNAEETFITNTFLRIENGYGEEASSKEILLSLILLMFSSNKM